MNATSKGHYISQIIVRGLCTTAVLFTCRVTHKDLKTLIIKHTIAHKLSYLFSREKHIRISKLDKGILPLRGKNNSSKK